MGEVITTALHPREQKEARQKEKADGHPPAS
jgi:hypothetical protein